jgi:hypothetical protein
MGMKSWSRASAVLAVVIPCGACGAPADEGDATEGADPNLGTVTEPFKVFDDTTVYPALNRIKSANLRICLAGAVTASNRPNLETWVREAVGEWVDAIQPASTVPLQRGVNFTGSPCDLYVWIQPGVGRSYAGTNITVIYEDDLNEQTVLHEFGHLFGAADTYVEGELRCQDDQPRSVMCPGGTIYVRPQTDDILSVQEAFCYSQPECKRRWDSPGMNWCYSDGHELHFGDFNRDGRQDMLCHRTSDGYKWISNANSLGRFTGTSWESAMNWCGNGGRLFIGDFNGDDRDDLLCHRMSDGYKWIAHANSSGRFTGTTWEGNMNWCSHQGGSLLIGDFDGNNRDDMLCHDVYTGRKWIAHSTASGTFTGTTWESAMNWCVLPGGLSIGRFNQDNRDDMLCHDLNTGTKYIAYATSSGTFTGTNWSAALNWCANESIQVADVNADGREDMICHDRFSGRNWISLAKSDGTFAGTTRTSIPDWPLRCVDENGSFRIADVNADGASDFICHKGQTGAKHIFYQSTLR